jgi:chromate transport protein ChrA
MKEKPKSTTTKVVTIKKGSVSQLEAKPTARDRLEAVLEAERFRLSSLVVSLALIIVFSAIILVICCILISSFKLPLLTMASENFRAAPVIMVIASCLSIGTSRIAQKFYHNIMYTTTFESFLNGKE